MNYIYEDDVNYHEDCDDEDYQIEKYCDNNGMDCPYCSNGCSDCLL